MSFFESLFSGAKALFGGLVTIATELVRAVFTEFDSSNLGRAATQLVTGVSKRVFGQATDLAGEERELAAKRLRDGRTTSRDLERLQEIEAERDQLRKELDAAKAREAAQALREAEGELVARPLTSDETSASVGIISSKTCPECSGTMRIRQTGFNSTQQRYRFYWQCTASRLPPCPTLRLDPEADAATVLRKPDADLDGPTATRRAAWNQPSVLASAHGRLRAGLGDADEDVVCPKHLLPMKLMPKGRPTGLMLDSYEYVCMCVNPDGRACDQAIPVSTFPQVSAVLRRREGRGILDN